MSECVRVCVRELETTDQTALVMCVIAAIVRQCNVGGVWGSAGRGGVWWSWWCVGSPA